MTANTMRLALKGFLAERPDASQDELIDFIVTELVKPEPWHESFEKEVVKRLDDLSKQVAGARRPYRERFLRPLSYPPPVERFDADWRTVPFGAYPDSGR